MKKLAFLFVLVVSVFVFGTERSSAATDLESWCKAKVEEWDAGLRTCIVSGNPNIGVDEPVAIAIGETLLIKGAATMFVYGNLDIDGTINNNGTISNSPPDFVNRWVTNDGTINNTGAFKNGIEGTFINNGTFNNDGTIHSRSSFQNNLGVINNFGIFDSNGTLTNHNIFNNQNVLLINEYLFNFSDGTIDNSGTIRNLGSYGILDNDGVINNSGQIFSRKSLENNGEVHNLASFYNYDIVENNGSIDNDGSFFNICDGVVNGNALTGAGAVYDLDNCVFTPIIMRN